MDTFNREEEWRPVKGYEGLYEVSSFGRVKSLERWVKGPHGEDRLKKSRIFKKHNCANGYTVVCLYKNGVGKDKKVHRLVAEAFLENPNGWPQINHKDEVRDNNHVSNLEYCSAKYNLEYNNGQKRRGNSNRGKKRSAEICQKFSEAQKLYHQLNPNARWEHAERVKEFNRRDRSAIEKRSRKRMIPIVQLAKDGTYIRSWDSCTTAAKELNLSISNLNSCCRGNVMTAYGYVWKYKSDYEKEQGQ